MQSALRGGDAKRCKCLFVNALTLLRIPGALFLLASKPLSTPFLAVYTLSALTDALDGILARRFDCASAFGAQLDSIADTALLFAMLVRIVPTIWSALAPVLRAGALFAVLLRGAYCIAHGCALLPHTLQNRAAGIALFALPFAASTAILVPCASVTIGLSILAAISDLLYPASRGSRRRLQRTGASDRMVRDTAQYDSGRNA